MAVARLPSQIRGDRGGFIAVVAERVVTIAGGHAHLDGKLCRVSNMGDLTDEAILRGVRTVGEALGVDADVEAGVDAARGVAIGR